MQKESEILFYTTAMNEVKIDVLYESENIWLSQKKMAILFDVKTPAINKHLKNIFDAAELQEEEVISILETTVADSKNYLTNFYNFDKYSVIRNYRINANNGKTYET